MSGPLKGIRIIELAGIGPAPFCAMMLGDLGAEVIRVERGSEGFAMPDPLRRNRRSIALNLKSAEAREALMKLVGTADALIEGFRPGVAERLQLGPEDCWKHNPRLVYGRMTGWGQDGPMAQAAGHDINYIALTGALHLIGEPGRKPVPPLNLIGDFGGGGMLLAFGVLAGIIEARGSGRGQVIDAAMTDGATALLAMFFGMRAGGIFKDETGQNFLGGGAPFYDTYQTKDGRYVSIGSLEPQFYALLLEKLGLQNDPQFAGLGSASVADPAARARWPALRAELTKLFLTRTQAEWSQLMEGTDICYAPVLTLEEAARHPHNVARKTFIEVGGVVQNAPAPRFSRTAAATPTPAKKAGSDTEALLREAGYSDADIARLRSAGALS
jgi:alpha-methylacyl-CoA racemase